jgi:hypothetical protein
MTAGWLEVQSVGASISRTNVATYALVLRVVNTCEELRSMVNAP